MDSESALGDDLSSSFGYREHASRREGKRKARTSVLYTDLEWAAIVVAAGKEGMKPGAWLAQVAYEAACRCNSGEPLDRDLVSELIAEMQKRRRVLTNIGNNVNALAKTANSTGELDNENAAATVLRLIRNSVRSSDEVLGRVRKELLP